MTIDVIWKPGSNIFLVWKLCDIQSLRKTYRIMGNLVGALPVFPLQTNFQGIPLQLLLEEVIFGFSRGWFRILTSKASCSCKCKCKCKCKGKSISISKPKSKSKSKIIEIPICLEETEEKENLEEIDFSQMYRTHKDDLFYLSYRELHTKGFYITLGSKFGGDFLVYPGNPENFHSSFIVSVVPECKTLSPLDLVRYGRLAKAGKKIAIIVTRKQNTLEWISIDFKGL